MTPEQAIVVGLIASALTLGLRILSVYLGYRPSRAVLNVVLYVVATGLAFVWSPVIAPTFPPYGGDPSTFVVALLQYLASWLAIGAPIFAFATLIYNLLYEKVVVPLKIKIAQKLGVVV